MKTTKYYEGQGKKKPIKAPAYDHFKKFDDPKDYLASGPLSAAVDVAITLGQPLLLTGEPGTGKTKLAESIAYELDLEKPLIFNAKTSSQAQDAFYKYNALGHFHKAQIEKSKEIDIYDYIRTNALGTAILKANGYENIKDFLDEKTTAGDSQRSVVLIDEIDKAPRDFPNDMLYEIEQMSFIISETDQPLKLEHPGFRPIVIITSNSEKNLPEAFLRRCVFHHIDFPVKKDLIDIVNRRLDLSEAFKSNMLEAAVDHFLRIRDNKNIRKLPATAELLSWIHLLNELQLNAESDIPSEVKRLADTYSLLVKNKDDLKLLRKE